MGKLKGKCISPLLTETGWCKVISNWDFGVWKPKGEAKKISLKCSEE